MIHLSSNYYLRRMASMQYAPDTGGGEGGDTGAAGDEGGGTGTEGEGGDTDEGGSEEIKDPEKKRLADEAARHRREKKEAEQKLADANKRLKALEDKDKSDLEKAQGDLKSTQEENEQLRQTNERLVLESEFHRLAAGRFRDPADALALLDRSKVEIDAKEGRASGVKEAIDKLAKAKPYLLKSEEGGDPTGSPFNRRSGQGSSTDAEALRKRFPSINA